MSSPDLLTICGAAFVAVFILLSLLAAIMRLILLVFPVKEEGVDAAIVAAVAATFQSLYPGMRITKMEEVK